MKINTVKFDFDQEILRKYKLSDLSFSPFRKYLFIFGHTQKSLIYWYSDLVLFDKQWMDIRYISNIWSIWAHIQISNLKVKKNYCRYLDSQCFPFFVTYKWIQKARRLVPGRFFRIDKCSEFTLDWSIWKVLHSGVLKPYLQTIG